jgi:hypothetical protein
MYFSILDYAGNTLTGTYESVAALKIICFVLHTYFIWLGLQASLWAIGNAFWYVLPFVNNNATIFGYLGN